MNETVKIAMRPGMYRRVLGEYVWAEANGFKADVDIPTAAELLTYPGGGYWLGERPRPAALKALAEAMNIDPRNLVLPAEEKAAERTLDQVTGGKWAMQLSEHGIRRPEQLAALDAAGQEQLATVSGASLDEVRAWVQQAKQE
jgi:hypothetical protein